MLTFQVVMAPVASTFFGLSGDLGGDGCARGDEVGDLRHYEGRRPGQDCSSQKPGEAEVENSSRCR